MENILLNGKPMKNSRWIPNARTEKNKEVQKYIKKGWRVVLSEYDRENAKWYTLVEEK